MGSVAFGVSVLTNPAAVGSGRAPIATGTESPLPASTVGDAVAAVKRSCTEREIRTGWVPVTAVCSG